MPFTPQDFTKDNTTRLSVIVMDLMGKTPMTPFHSLGDTQKQRFNRLMNKYIKEDLGDDDWENILLDDFNRIIRETILTEEFDPSKQFIKELNTDNTLMLTEEQKEFFKDKTDELVKITGEKK